MFNIFRKEVNSYLNSLIAYIVITIFLTAMGLFMWVFPKTNVFDSSFADMYTFFSLAPPLTDWQIILGKYFSSLALVIVAIFPTLIYYYSVYSLGAPEGNIDSA